MEQNCYLSLGLLLDCYMRGKKKKTQQFQLVQVSVILGLYYLQLTLTLTDTFFYMWEEEPDDSLWALHLAATMLSIQDLLQHRAARIQWCILWESVGACSLPPALAPRAWHCAPIKVEERNPALLLFPWLCPHSLLGTRCAWLHSTQRVMLGADSCHFFP